MSEKKILYVEGDLILIEGLKYTFEKNGFQVDNARTVTEAYQSIRTDRYDLLLLDVTLPDGTGIDICKEVRKTSAVPIIFLTASDEEISIVKGLDMGGDERICWKWETESRPHSAKGTFAPTGCLRRRFAWKRKGAPWSSQTDFHPLA